MSQGKRWPTAKYPELVTKGLVLRLQVRGINATASATKLVGLLAYHGTLVGGLIAVIAGFKWLNLSWGLGIEVFGLLVTLVGGFVSGWPRLSPRVDEPSDIKALFLAEADQLLQMQVEEMANRSVAQQKDLKWERRWITCSALIGVAGLIVALIGAHSHIF